MVMGVIMRESAGPWDSPIVLVKKSNGKLRFCVDYRRVNAVNSKNVFPMPCIDDIMDQLNGKMVFSMLEVKNGYW